MKKITCMIVEDEPVSQEILRRYIQDLGELELVAVCNNAIEAGGALRQRRVDLLFLDITMPKLSGLDFYRSLTDPPEVIFTTAYPQFAVEGFEVNAIDYLVKPFSFERFVKAVNKLQSGSAVDQTGPGYILLQADKRMHRIDTDDIFYLEAMGDYVKVHTTDKTIIVHHTLQKLMEILPVGKFFRVHKSFIISLKRISYIEGNMVVIDKTQVPIGQTYRNDFLSALQQKR